MKNFTINSDSIINTTISNEYNGNPFKNLAETTITFDLNLYDIWKDLENSEFSEMFSEESFIAIVKDSLQKVNIETNPYISTADFILVIDWPNSVDFNEIHLNEFLNDFSVNLNLEIQNILGDNLKNFLRMKEEERLEETRIENENIIRSKVSKKVIEKYPSTCSLIFSAANLPLNFDLKNDFQEDSGRLFSLSRNKENRKEQIKIINDSKEFSHFEYIQKNNETLIKLYISEDMKNEINNYRKIATNEVYKINKRNLKIK